MRAVVGLAALAALAARAAAQTCIPLSNSQQCRAFNASSISTDSMLVGFFPFLAYVSNVQDFDRELTEYAASTYVTTKYTTLFGCTNVNAANTTGYYARYTTSFICNSIVQNSRGPCGLTDATAKPLCADSCADFALSEEEIVSSNTYCAGRNADYASQLRADFTNCALPANSLTTTCVEASANEPDNCGFSNNLVGLCNYCQASTENATDSCCFTSNATGRCQGVTLPVFSSIANLFSTTSASSSGAATATSSSNNGAGNGGHGGLSGGAIAGIVIGSIVGFLLLLALIILGCVALRRRHSPSSNSSLLNQPSPQRKGAPSSAMAYVPPPSSSQQGYEVLPGGRVARMNAMQNDMPPEVGPRGGMFNGDTPVSGEKSAGIMGVVKSTPGAQDSEPDSNDYSSPEGVASGQSEQLPFFKDYYSNDDIHPNDKVSVLWAYQPRAGDEFELERGDMLKVVGIWDDGWATGVRIDDRAEDYDGKLHNLQRDSGVSQGSVAREGSPAPTGEIKAFPLVCVCLPDAWKKTVDGDSSTENTSGPLGTT